MNRTLPSEQATIQSLGVDGSGRRQSLQSVATWLTQRKLFVLLVLASIGSLATFRQTDIDFWWHLKTGEIIAQTWSVPSADPYSFTVAGKAWIAHEWLWEVFVYWLVSFGGFGLAVAVSAIIVALTYGLLYRLLRQFGLNEYAGGLVVFWAGVMAMRSMGVRPRELTALFLVVYLSRLLLYREGKVGQIWLLPCIMLIWVNAHGPFVLGLVVLGAFVLEALVEWFRRNRPFPSHLIRVALATVAACMVNPSGPAMLLYPFGYYLQGENPSFSQVTEFASPNFHNPFYWPFAASLLLFIVLKPADAKRWRLADMLLVVAFAFQALVSVRHVAVYAIIAAPYLGCLLRDNLRLARELQPLKPSLPMAVANWVLLLLVPVAVSVAVANTDLQERHQFRPEPLPMEMPVKGVRYIEDHALPDPVFNHQPWGGYLIYRWYPDRKVFIDGRIDMYGADLVDEYRRVVTVKPDWREVLDRYQIQTILIQKDSPLSLLLLADGGWTRVFQGEVEDVFVRASR